MWHALAWLYVLNAALVVDCAQNRREPYWYVVLISLGPLGALAYLVANWETITFPVSAASVLRALGRKPVLKRCPRCAKQVDRLHQVEQGRTVHLMCHDCQAEVLAV